MVPFRRPVRLDVEHGQTGHRGGANPAAAHPGQPGPELDVQSAGQAAVYRGGGLGGGHCAADQDHAFGADLLGQLRNVGQRRPARNAQPGCHLDLPAHDTSDSVTELRLVGEHLPDGCGVLVGAHQEHGLQVLPVRSLALQPPAEVPAQHDDQYGGAYRSLYGGCGGYLEKVPESQPEAARTTRLRPWPRLSGRPGGRTQSTPRSGRGGPSGSPRASKQQRPALRLPSGPDAGGSGKA